MARIIQALLGKIKIQRQLYLVFFLTVAVIVLLLGSYLTYRTISVQHERAYAQLESDNLRARSVLFDATINFYNLTEDLLSDRELQRILTAQYADAGTSSLPIWSGGRIEQILRTHTSISSLCIYVTNPTITQDRVIRNEITENVEKWFEQVKTPGSIYWESTGYQNPNGLSELTLIRSLPLHNADYKAIIVMSMSNNYLKNRIQNNELFTSLSLDRDPIFYSTTRALQGTPETAPIDYTRRTYRHIGRIEYQGGDAFSYITSLPIYRSEQTIYVTSLDFYMPRYIFQVGVLCSSVVLLAILLPFLIIRVYAKNLSTRIDTLKNAMHHAKNGNYDIIDSFQGNDELSVTFSGLKELIANVREQQTRIFQSQIKEGEMQNKQREMEFKLLSSQINPHFIYNTLETIRMMALDAGNTEVERSIKLFANTMRYVLENTMTSHTTLDKELRYIEDYLAIQKLRFFDKVNYTLVKPDDFQAEKYQILPLLIQPLIENAIIHGLTEVDYPGKITLSISHDGSRMLFIDVEDNGTGINQEKLSVLSSQIEHGESRPEHIGISNIAQRIKLFYGDEHGVEIRSGKDGTRVRLKLPL